MARLANISMTNYIQNYLAGDNASVPAKYQGDDYLDGGVGWDNLTGFCDDDELFGDAGNHFLWGGILLGGSNADTLWGKKGKDTLDDRDGNDELYGEAGNDELLSGQGADLFEISDGNDPLDGGKSSDTYLAGAGDYIVGNQRTTTSVFFSAVSYITANSLPWRRAA